jgi:thiol-disulfide isomerase/thioredoxin
MDSVGLGAVAAVLVAGVAIGLWRRATNGRLKAAAAPKAAAARSAAVPKATAGDEPMSEEAPAGERIDPALLAELGVAPGQATLLQFSSAFCAPCRAVRRISADVAGLVPGVQHVEVDAESHLDAVRALDVWRTPTLFVLEADGRVARRATGVPAKAQLIAALGELDTLTGDRR